jgi:DNA-binding NarL/FixJ family response regulator
MAKGIYLPPAVFLGDSQSATERGQVARISAAATPVTKTPADLGLTTRQAEVLHLILQGKPAKIISKELGLSGSTVKVHTSAVLRALNVTTRTQAVIAAGKIGLRFDAQPIR